MLVTECVHNEAIFGDECVAVGWNPNSCFFRKLTPQK
jgi:hypothetical protein